MRRPGRLLRHRCPRTVLATTALLVASTVVSGESVVVRHVEGIVHGFLVLRTLEGTTIANGDLVQIARGSQVTSRLTFRFRDGSVYDETAVFWQRGQFRLITDRLAEKGPAFPHPLEMSIDARAGTVTVRYSDGGEEKTATKRLTLPPDVCNGLVLTLLKNVDPKKPPQSFSFVAATPAPRLIKLSIASSAEEPFSTAGERRLATHYVLKPVIGGLSGLLAPLVGKQPPDSHVWIAVGEAPAFVRSEQQFYFGGPVWRVELVAPAWHDEGDR